MPSAPNASAPLDNAEPTIFQTPAWARYFSLIATIVLVVVTALVLALAIFLLFKREWWLGAFVAAVAIFLAGLTEAYRSLGMAMVQRAYVLSRKQGDKIFLFEDRALGTPIETPMVTQIAEAIVARAHVPLHDLGMVEGCGGLLAVWGTHAPDWAAPSLPLAQQLRLWRHAAATGTFAIAVIIVALAIRLIAGP